MRSSTFKCNMKYAAYALAGFLVTLAIVNFVDNQYLKTSEIIDDQDVLLKKINYFKEHKDEYSVVFVGASRTYRQFDAVYFDSLVNRPGTAIKTFNFGAPGLGWTEVLYTLNLITKLKPANLKYVLFEPIPYSKIYPENLATAENLRVHDLPFTVLAVKNILSSNEHPIYLFHQTYFHTLSLLRRATCTGCTVNFITHRITNNDSRINNEDYSENQGYIALDDDKKIKPKKHQDFLETAGTKLPELVREQIKRIDAAASNPDKSNPADRQILALVDMAKSTGALPVMVVTPQLNNHSRMEGRTSYMEEVSGIRVWTYLDPREYPEFSLAENRWEDLHLNKKGSRLYTEKVAERFKQSFNPVSK